MGKHKWQKFQEVMKGTDENDEIKNKTDSFDKPLELKDLRETRFDPMGDSLIELAELAEMEKKLNSPKLESEKLAPEKLDSEFEVDDPDNPGSKNSLV